MDIFKNFVTEKSNTVNNSKGEKFNHLSSFTLNNVPLSFANSLRRVMLSNIPVVAFDDTWSDNELSRSIVIHKNTSGIHNEFLSHRISLIPLYLGEDILKLVTKYNIQTNTRVFDFKNQQVPHFKMNIKNDKEMRSFMELSDANSSIVVTNNHFTYTDDLLESNKANYPTENKIILPDLYTGDYIALNILKPNVLDDNLGEEIDLIAKPTIGIGKQHARYCPVGTVSFQLEVNEDLIEDVFLKKLNYTNKERVEKKLKPLNSQEEAKFRKSFNLLDKDRVFKTNGFGNPNSFIFNVESIGILEANQIVFDALTILELKVLDILNSIKISENPETLYTFNVLNSKLTFSRSDDLLDGFVINLDNENHTLGNVISEYLKSIYIGKYSINSNILSFASYSMPHPLKENIKFKLKLKSFTHTELNKINQFIYTKLFKSISTKEIDDENAIKSNIYLLIFTSCLKTIYNDIMLVKSEYSKNTGITLNSFIINDEEEYFNVFNELPLVFTDLDGFHKTTNIINAVDKLSVNEIKEPDVVTKTPEIFKDDEADVDQSYLEQIEPQYGSEIINHLQKINSEWTIQKEALSRIHEYMPEMKKTYLVQVLEILDTKVKILLKKNQKEFVVDITSFLRDFYPKKRRKISLKKKISSVKSATTDSIATEKLLAD